MAQREKSAVFTTDKNGESNTLELEEGMYYVKKRKHQNGYKLDERIYPVTVTSGQTAEVNVKDVPVYSDIELLLDKIVKESKEESTWRWKPGRCRVYSTLLCRQIYAGIFA